jgi:Flp pilus assembly pilin Flp
LSEKAHRLLLALASQIDLRGEDGQTFVEYALVLILVAVAVAVLTAWSGLDTAIGNAISSVINQL